MKLKIKDKQLEIDFKNETITIEDEKYSELSNKFVAYSRGQYKKDGEKNGTENCN